jgi:preprotein translocase subunit SecA
MLRRKLVAELVERGCSKLLEEGEEDERPGLHCTVHDRGFPKNRQFRKLMQDPARCKNLCSVPKAFYLQDNARRLCRIVDEYLYYAVDMKMNSRLS